MPRFEHDPRFGRAYLFEAMRHVVLEEMKNPSGSGKYLPEDLKERYLNEVVGIIIRKLSLLSIDGYFVESKDADAQHYAGTIVSTITNAAAEDDFSLEKLQTMLLDLAHWVEKDSKQNKAALPIDFPNGCLKDNQGQDILWDTHRINVKLDSGKERKETAPEFIKRVYGEYLSESFGRAEIGHLDPKLYSSLGTYISRHKGIPANLKLDLPTVSQRNDKWVDKVLAGQDDHFASLNGEEAIRAGARVRSIEQRRRAK